MFKTFSCFKGPGWSLTYSEELETGNLQIENFLETFSPKFCVRFFCYYHSHIPNQPYVNSFRCSESHRSDIQPLNSLFMFPKSTEAARSAWWLSVRSHILVRYWFYVSLSRQCRCVLWATGPHSGNDHPRFCGKGVNVCRKRQGVLKKEQNSWRRQRMKI
jgi:hypothetical protein